MLTSLAHLPSTVWLLGLVSLFNDSASELVYPLLPLYLSSVLMAEPRALGIDKRGRTRSDPNGTYFSFFGWPCSRTYALASARGLVSIG